MEENQLNQIKCPKCGSSEIEPNSNGKLQCRYCGNEFDNQPFRTDNNISILKGTEIGLGAQNISQQASNIVTIKCESCGAEIVVDTSNVSTARCHWCHSILNINSRIDNGFAPDAILPFTITKEDAVAKINKFVKKRRAFADPEFKKHYKPENIMGVYFPYYVVDANCHPKLSGTGEIEVRHWETGSDDHPTHHYDADAYYVERSFDMTVNNLVIESNNNYTDKIDESKTNNIINSIMPYDLENAISYSSNYLIGYTSEKRNINIQETQGKVFRQLQDIARFAILDDIKQYKRRGVRWEQEELNLEGIKWVTIYLPVWIYSYIEKENEKQTIHYVAVNGRTGETMGSVPLSRRKMKLLSNTAGIGILISALSFAAFPFFLILGNHEAPEHLDSSFFLKVDFPLIGLVILMIFVIMMFYAFHIQNKYRNDKARHQYEKETEHTITNIKSNDSLLEQYKDISRYQVEGRNDKKIEGEYAPDPNVTILKY